MHMPTRAHTRLYKGASQLLSRLDSSVGGSISIVQIPLAKTSSRDTSSQHHNQQSTNSPPRNAVNRSSCHLTPDFTTTAGPAGCILFDLTYILPDRWSEPSFPSQDLSHDRKPPFGF